VCDRRRLSQDRWVVTLIRVAGDVIAGTLMAVTLCLFSPHHRRQTHALKNHPVLFAQFGSALRLALYSFSGSHLAKALYPEKTERISA